MNANQQADQLAKSNDYKEVSSSQAQSLANRGHLVISVWHNPKAGHSGHSATVRPEGVLGDHPAGANGPIISNVGGSVGVAKESKVYPKSARQNNEVHFYTPR